MTRRSRCHTLELSCAAFRVRRTVVGDIYMPASSCQQERGPDNADCS
jgi:hypothetical protein